MKFILNKQIKYYTKAIFKWISLSIALLFVIMAITFIRYKPVFSVSISGEQVGYIKNKEEFENKIQKLVSEKQTQNVAYIENEIVPEYQYTFVSNNVETNEIELIAKVEEQTKFTYKYYAVTIESEQKAIVNSLQEAEELVAELKKAHKQSSNKIGINEVYTQNQNEYETVSVKVATNEVSQELQEIEDASVNGIYLSQKPITGVITSRYGSRESIRQFPHTGLDIAAPLGTPIKAAAGGTVKWSGDYGSYGNLVIVDCGNGVEIYYGHCSKLLVKKGQTVKAGDIVGEVGSTGNSTGNHLHFEIRVNNARVNPQNYIYK